MPNKTEPLLLAEIKPSKRLAQLLAVMHALALGASLANALPFGIKLALAAAIAIHLHWITRRTKTEQYRIRHSDALGWEIDSGEGFRTMQISGSTVITTFAIFLHISTDSHRQSLLITSDALSADDYRRLIVRLKTDGPNQPEQN